jgi:glycosyltransferase involved in cell wall biosynthesis
MGHGVPIVAYGVAAVPETVAGAGLVLPDKSPVPFAAAVGRVLRDPELRTVLATAGRDRAAGFDLAASTTRFVALVQEAVGA